MLVRSTFLPLLNDDGYPLPSTGSTAKRQPHHSLLTFINQGLDSLLKDLKPTHGTDVTEKSPSELLRAFHPRAQAFLSSKPWHLVNYYINEMGRTSIDITQDGVKQERDVPHVYVTHLIDHYNNAAADTYDITLLSPTRMSCRRLLQTVIELSEAVFQTIRAEEVRQTTRNVIKGADPVEIIVIDDSDDEGDSDDEDKLRSAKRPRFSEVEDTMEQVDTIDWTIPLL